MSRSSVLIFALSCACTAEPATPTALTQAVIYASDDRVELYSAPTLELRSFGELSVVALVEDSAWNGESSSVFAAPSWATRRGLCPDVRFANQPAASTCSGILLGDDLVLTAGHCVENLACESLSIVFGYHYLDEGKANGLGEQHVYRCAEVLTSARPTLLENLDYGWLRLDRPVSSPRRAARLASQSDVVGRPGPLHAFTYGGGIPLKLQTNAFMLAPVREERDYFVTSLDLFEGSSGGPIVDDEGKVVGIVSRGNADYVQTSAGCFALSELPESEAAERATFAFQALAGLCRDAPNSTGLCHDADDPSPIQGQELGCAAGRRPAYSEPIWLLALGYVAALRGRALMSRHKQGKGCPIRRRRGSAPD